MSHTRIIAKGATSQSVILRAKTTATGVPVTITSATAGIALWYRRGLAAKVALAVSDLALLTTAWTASGLLLIADGVHRLDVADAAFATGVDEVTIGGSATGIDIEPCIVQLTGVDLQNTVRAGLTALPNAAAGANTGLPVVGTQIPNATAGASGGLPTDNSSLQVLSSFVGPSRPS